VSMYRIKECAASRCVSVCHVSSHTCECVMARVIEECVASSVCDRRVCGVKCASDICTRDVTHECVTCHRILWPLSRMTPLQIAVQQ